MPHGRWGVAPDPPSLDDVLRRLEAGRTPAARPRKRFGRTLDDALSASVEVYAHMYQEPEAGTSPRDAGLPFRNREAASHEVEELPGPWARDERPDVVASDATARRDEEFAAPDLGAGTTPPRFWDRLSGGEGK